MNRREFLRLTAVLPWFGATVGTTLSTRAIADPNALDEIVTPTVRTPTAGRARSQQRILVLVKLAGGNDGLNTLIPFSDSSYQQYRDYRPTIAVPKHQVLDIGGGQGMNPYLQVLRPYWEAGQLAWIRGVGYPHNDLSHFRSVDIWETGAAAGEYTEIGWLGSVVPQCKAGLHGIVIGDSMGPLAGKDCNAVAMQSPQTFLNQVDLLSDIAPTNITPALRHLTNVQHQLYDAGAQLSARLQRPSALGVSFSTSEIGRDLESVASMILSGVDATVYMVTLDGFDTHTNQVNVQSNLLHQLAAGLNSFAQAMQRGGRWNDVLLVTYSEFGRRVQENHGRGTDHGAASVQLVMGGRVRGGVYGDLPNLSQLDHDGNIPYEIDFRQVYSTIAQRWLGQNSQWKNFGVLPFV